ncbi:hypothetical protein Hypma_002046 [Hypsizygus marmoreus]|uniref:Uncharacterized protein n=1 Tax=Hypsizygus marmoreus TaxID=39966 RepID=A0A369J773_HYPMA|nr:hypothetical protein Hypma_002046 [Hypsizygus marmoreus]
MHAPLYPRWPGPYPMITKDVSKRHKKQKDDTYPLTQHHEPCDHHSKVSAARDEQPRRRRLRLQHTIEDFDGGDRVTSSSYGAAHLRAPRSPIYGQLALLWSRQIDVHSPETTTARPYLLTLATCSTANAACHPRAAAGSSSRHRHDRRRPRVVCPGFSSSGAIRFGVQNFTPYVTVHAHTHCLPRYQQATIKSTTGVSPAAQGARHNARVGIVGAVGGEMGVRTGRTRRSTPVLAVCSRYNEVDLPTGRVTHTTFHLPVELSTGLPDEHGDTTDKGNAALKRNAEIPNRNFPMSLTLGSSDGGRTAPVSPPLCTCADSNDFSVEELHDAMLRGRIARHRKIAQIVQAVPNPLALLLRTRTAGYVRRGLRRLPSHPVWPRSFHPPTISRRCTMLSDARSSPLRLSHPPTIPQARHLSLTVPIEYCHLARSHFHLRLHP